MNILLTGAWHDAGDYIERIEKLGHQVRFLQCEKEPLPCEYDWVEGVVGNGFFIYHEAEKFTNLKYIQLTSAGYDRIPMEYLEHRNIRIYNAKGVYSIPMAEYAVSSVLSLYKCQRFFYDNQRQHIWEKKRDLLELAGSNVCIVGCGSVGSECAKRFSAFGCNVYGVDLNEIENNEFLQIYDIKNIKEILPKADIVVLSLPLNHDMYHFFNKEIFDSFKNGAILVNVARGALIEMHSLVEALNNKLGGAVLDVFEDEPLEEKSALWDMEHVIITPHNSFVGSGNNKRLSALIMSNLETCQHEDFDSITQK